MKIKKWQTAFFLLAAASLIQFPGRARAIEGAEVGGMSEGPADSLPWNLPYDLPSQDELNTFKRNQEEISNLSDQEIEQAIKNQGADPEIFDMYRQLNSKSDPHMRLVVAAMKLDPGIQAALSIRKAAIAKWRAVVVEAVNARADELKAALKNKRITEKAFLDAAPELAPFKALSETQGSVTFIQHMADGLRAGLGVERAEVIAQELAGASKDNSAVPTAETSPAEKAEKKLEALKKSAPEKNSQAQQPPTPSASREALRSADQAKLRLILSTPQVDELAAFHHVIDALTDLVLPQLSGDQTMDQMASAVLGEVDHLKETFNLKSDDPAAQKAVADIQRFFSQTKDKIELLGLSSKGDAAAFKEKVQRLLSTLQVSAQTAQTTDALIARLNALLSVSSKGVSRPDFMIGFALVVFLGPFGILIYMLWNDSWKRQEASESRNAGSSYGEPDSHGMYF